MSGKTLPRTRGNYYNKVQLAKLNHQFFSIKRGSDETEWNM